ncbi:hypothetical protein OnM2_086044 [Erysiphe neolycopersici]|uniref:CCHC-type domain-containing protein n=1 Tax=Erysiphe neolycopersici TaxID=212602 RepID=A0A420HEB9_9PEZI|nr:hypothetical protein OnM2_086044 [Erysiphe neolycopersici]
MEAKCNAQRNQAEKTEGSRSIGRYTSQNKPPKPLSRHSFVNGTKNYSREMGIICVRCGDIGHKKPECIGSALEWWEQAYLKELVWPKANSNYAWFSDNGLGLKFRDIIDSNWRAHDKSPRMLEPSKSNLPVTTEIPNHSYEEFTGSSYVESPKPPNKTMSVMLGVSGEINKKRYA